MSRIRTLIVDDEPLARANLRVLIEAAPDLELIGECPDGEAAAAAISDLEPDVVFLDVRMPRLDGIGVLERIAPQAPWIVLVTAHEDYAVRAFEEGAIDYLLKPFDDERFAITLERIRERLAAGDPGEEPPAAQRDPEPGCYPARLLVKGTGRILVVQVEDIAWISGAGNYVRLHTDGRRVLHRATLGETMTLLDPARFVRIHRSTIVNVDRVRELEPIAKGAWRVRLHDGTELRSSAAYRQALEARLAAAQR